MRKAIVVLALAVPMLAACGSTAEGQSVQDCPNGEVCTVTIDYHGRPLECVTWGGSHGEVGMTCDFVAYHGNLP